jgi:hypothetical protein
MASRTEGEIEMCWTSMALKKGTHTFSK